MAHSDFLRAMHMTPLRDLVGTGAPQITENSLGSNAKRFLEKLCAMGFSQNPPTPLWR